MLVMQNISYIEVSDNYKLETIFFAGGRMITLYIRLYLKDIIHVFFLFIILYFCYLYISDMEIKLFDNSRIRNILSEHVGTPE